MVIQSVFQYYGYPICISVLWLSNLYFITMVIQSVFHHYGYPLWILVLWLSILYFRRWLRICPGELSYFKIGEENQEALNIIKLGPGFADIRKQDNNGFLVITNKKEYRYLYKDSYSALLQSILSHLSDKTSFNCDKKASTQRHDFEFLISLMELLTLHTCQIHLILSFSD